MTSIYIIGSLANPEIPKVAAKLREADFDAFDQWHAVGPEGDRFWQEHFKAKGYNLAQALKMDFVQTAFNFDKKHLDRCEAAVLVLPAGKSGHLELGYVIGSGKPGFILMEGDPERYDLMYGFATLCYSMEELISALGQRRTAWTGLATNTASYASIPGSASLEQSNRMLNWTDAQRHQVSDDDKVKNGTTSTH